MGIDIQGMSVLPALQPEVLSNSSGAPLIIDTNGWGHAKFFFITGTMAASSNISVAKVTECATSGGSYTDITGGGLASGDLDAATDDAVAAVEVDLTNKARLRYLKVVVTESGTANAPVAAVVALSRACPIEVPNTAALRGLTAEVSV